ncbi:MAG: dienelactone hydrolase [Bacteroidetes bacterium]|nr:dienelactone hydrolase [Bacteroidota bacterium]
MKKLILIISLLVPFIAGAQNIGETTLHFNDVSRQRPLTTEIWYPTADTIKKHDTNFQPFARMETVKDAAISGKYPLIMISHGTGGGRLTLEWLADILVKNGFIVAAVDHWGNTYDNKIAIDFVTPWERPQDISFVLTGLLKDDKFGPAVDRDRIGAAGFSIGGYTVIALAGAQLDYEELKNYTNSPAGTKELNVPEFPGLINVVRSGKVEESFNKSPRLLKDSRIKAFFAICPAIGQGFVKSEQFNKVDNPLYIVGAESDSIAPYKTNALHYHELIPKSHYFLVKGKVGHYVFLGEAAEPVKKQGPVYFVDDPSVNRHKVHEEVGQIAVRFFKQNLK